MVHSLHHPQAPHPETVRYQPGEGILGLLLEQPRTVMLKRVADEPRFSTGWACTPRTTFIAIANQGWQRGVRRAGNCSRKTKTTLARRPWPSFGNGRQPDRQSVQLAREVAQERHALIEERDSLRRTVRQQFGF